MFKTMPTCNAVSTEKYATAEYVKKNSMLADYLK